jgi:proteasome lid subunit RPN8/RPN11
MDDIPIYLKTDPQAPRPTDPEFYWVTAGGTFLCRNHPFFVSDVPAPRPPRSLAMHSPACVVGYPRLGVAALEYIVGFFDRVFALHQSESIVLLYWDTLRQRYRLRVPQQQATVWESYSGRRSPLDVAYKPPLDVLPHEWLVGDIHCHGDIGAYASQKDREDERYQDGIHAIVGRIDREPPEFHAEMSVDGTRFRLRFEHIFQGYGTRRRTVPQAWLDQVSVVVERSRGWSAPSGGERGFGLPSLGFGPAGRSGPPPYRRDWFDS